MLFDVTLPQNNSNISDDKIRYLLKTLTSEKTDLLGSSVADHITNTANGSSLGQLHGDLLYGGAGADVLKGGSNKDIIIGGDGEDILIGGGEG